MVSVGRSWRWCGCENMGFEMSGWECVQRLVGTYICEIDDRLLLHVRIDISLTPKHDNQPGC
jgi:hypothetical protein